MAKTPKPPLSIRIFPAGLPDGYRVGEAGREPGNVHITQYGGEVVGPLSPNDARALAAALNAAADAIDP